MNHQFHHSMTHNKTPPPKKKQQPKMFSKWKLEAIRLQLLNLTSFAPLLPPLLANPPSSSAAHPAAGVWLPCLCPGLVRCGGWSSMGSTAHAHSLAFKGDPAAAVGLHIGTRNVGPNVSKRKLHPRTKNMSGTMCAEQLFPSIGAYSLSVTSSTTDLKND